MKCKIKNLNGIVFEIDKKEFFKHIHDLGYISLFQICCENFEYTLEVRRFKANRTKIEYKKVFYNDEYPRKVINHYYSNAFYIIYNDRNQKVNLSEFERDFKNAYPTKKRKSRFYKKRKGKILNNANSHKGVGHKKEYHNLTEDLDFNVKSRKNRLNYIKDKFIFFYDSPCYVKIERSWKNNRKTQYK